MIKSIKLRLTLLYVAIFGVILLVCSFLAYWTAHRELHRDMSRELRRDLRGFVSHFIEEVDEVNRGIHPSLSEEIDDYLLPAKALALIEDANRTIIYESPQIRASRDRLQRMDFTSLEHGSDIEIRDSVLDLGGRSSDVKMASVVLRDEEVKSYRIIFLKDASIIAKRLTRFLQYGMIGLPLLLVLSFGIGYWFIHRVLRPVDDITREARAVGILSMEKRVPVPPAEGELKRLAQTFNDMLDRLQQAVLELRKFTADVSHELKTPLANLRSQVELALSGIHSREDYPQILSSVLEDIVRIAQIVESMLLLAQVEAKEFTLEKRSVSMDELVQELYEVGRAMGKAGRVEVSCEDPLPGIVVMGDPVLLRRGCFNLVENAIKYTREGGSVRLFLSADDGHAVFRVRDSGVGISPEHLPYIFKRFYRVDKARSRERGGTGLGLAIARSVVEVHGGTITVESRPGQGSQFTVTLPTTPS